MGEHVLSETYYSSLTITLSLTIKYKEQSENLEIYTAKIL